MYYQEPHFCRTINKDPDTIFSHSLHVTAEDSVEAIKQACDDFQTAAKESSVGWDRPIVKLEVKKEPKNQQ